jgi:hypothetical protein
MKILSEMNTQIKEDLKKLKLKKNQHFKWVSEIHDYRFCANKMEFNIITKEYTYKYPLQIVCLLDLRKDGYKMPSEMNAIKHLAFEGEMVDQMPEYFDDLEKVFEYFFDYVLNDDTSMVYRILVEVKDKKDWVIVYLDANNCKKIKN